MAFKKEKKGCDYNAEIKSLKSGGPGRLYMLYGQEDYLRDCFYAELKKLCLPNGDDGFSYRRFDGPEIELPQLSNALDSVPFLSERTFVELRDVDINRLKEPELFLKIISDIPDYCTVCLMQDFRYVPDGRLKTVKFLKEKGKALEFSGQDADALIGWIKRRFSALGKSIDSAAARKLIFISGDLMNRLIPEISKIAAYTSGETVTENDVEKAASHIPEAQAFKMTDFIGARNFDAAFAVLGELLSDRNNDPYAVLGALGFTIRRLFGVGLALNSGRHKADIAKDFSILDFVADKTIASARKFSLEKLRIALLICEETEFAMKTSTESPEELLKEAVLRIAVI